MLYLLKIKSVFTSFLRADEFFSRASAMLVKGSANLDSELAHRRNIGMNSVISSSKSRKQDKINRKKNLYFTGLITTLQCKYVMIVRVCVVLKTTVGVVMSLTFQN